MSEKNVYAPICKTYKPFDPPTSNPIFIPTDLKTCSHVFLRYDAVRKPLQPIYDGPFQVLQRGEKTLTILQNGRESVISIDRVKPAYLDKPVTENSASVFHSYPPDKKTGKPILVTRSGRHVRFPDCYKV
ncbi:unnamed protein product [Hymenolepis diminuta]|uniref:Pol polyprotein n=1 Tax=Hymenolepis diminuta TaxID=6216 RepID=A0A0R3SVR0_HYMDI|nr:unnamed protein product [Hymenolepis diminuta]